MRNVAWRFSARFLAPLIVITLGATEQTTPPPSFSFHFSFPTHPESRFAIVSMKFFTFALYSLKVNVLNMLVVGQRSSSLNLNYLHSSTVQPAPMATVPGDEVPNSCSYASNITDSPIF